MAVGAMTAVAASATRVRGPRVRLVALRLPPATIAVPVGISAAARVTAVPVAAVAAAVSAVAAAAVSASRRAPWSS